MKKIIISLFLVMITLGAWSTPSYAGGWEEAGKVFAAIEGLRILSGGDIDPIGTIIGPREKKYQHRHKRKHSHRRHGRYHRHKRKKYVEYCEVSRVWVPTYVTKRRYVPRSKNYDEYGNLVVTSGHYVVYKEERNGYWKTVKDCHI